MTPLKQHCDDSRILTALIILILAVGALSTVAFKNYQSAQDAHDDTITAQKKLDQYTRLACERGNTLRGYLIIRGELLNDPNGSNGAADQVFEITDCSGTARDPMTPADRAAFLNDLAETMGVLPEYEKALLSQ